MMDANGMSEKELIEWAVRWYKNGRFEWVYQIANHMEAIGFDRMEVLKEIRNAS